MSKTKSTIPFGILFLAIIYAFGAITLLTFLFINPEQAARVVAQRHGLLFSTGNWILPIVAALALLISFGLYSRSRWGYVLTILYLIYFVSVNWFMLRSQADLMFIGNLVWSFLVILYLFIVRKWFFGDQLAGKIQTKNAPSRR